MGATNKNSTLRKCGDLFINIKHFQKKSKKNFTFHCTLCNMDFDQLKKFSKHLEDHLEYFQNSHDNITDNKTCFETEKIQVKSELVEQLNDADECGVLSDHETLLDYDDPLGTQLPQKADMTVEPTIHNEENDVEHKGRDSIICSTTTSTIVDTVKSSENNLNNLVVAVLSSEYTSDSDSELEKSSKTSKNATNLKHGNFKKPKKRRRVIIESILQFLIQQYKKYAILWQTDDIAFGIKMKKYEIYSQIAETLKLEKNIIINLEDLNYHIRYLNELYSKDKEQELKCQMEGKDFQPESEHYKELSFLRCSQGPFLCSTCNVILPRYHPYCQHMAEHKDTQPYKCPLCDSTFVNYHKYLVHKKRHLGILDFHCKICGKGYMFRNDLEWHVTSHTGDKPYLCPICGTGFRARHGYDNHVRRHEERFRHECHICKRGFNQLHALNSHVKSHLNIRDVLCKICGKGFVHTKYLKRHELIHGKEKHYKCNECGKAFFQPCGLRAHRKNHHS